MSEYIKRQDAIDIATKPYRYESDRLTALQEIPVINIDDKKMEQITAFCEPKYLGENPSIGCRVGMCKCGNIVRSYQNYCDLCGVELEW